MQALLGDPPLQQELEPYYGIPVIQEYITELPEGHTLGRYVMGDMSMSRYSMDD